jgi:deoxyadenosine/deoxycytidine kinase
LARAHWPAEGVVVADYGFCQDRLFAEMRLPAEDFPLYEQVWARLAPIVRPPDVLICLEAAEPVLLERIARRGRTFESPIDAGFLAAQRAAYAGVTDRATCPVLRIDAAAQDLRRASVRADLVKRLREMLT